jgi:hypothetical protein
VQGENVDDTTVRFHYKDPTKLVFLKSEEFVQQLASDETDEFDLKRKIETIFYDTSLATEPENKKAALAKFAYFEKLYGTEAEKQRKQQGACEEKLLAFHKRQELTDHRGQDDHEVDHEAEKAAAALGLKPEQYELLVEQSKLEGELNHANRLYKLNLRWSEWYRDTAKLRVENNPADLHKKPRLLRLN